jgi:hypothetical protein
MPPARRGTARSRLPEPQQFAVRRAEADGQRVVSEPSGRLAAAREGVSDARSPFESIPRRALMMGGFAGAVSCVLPWVAHAATAIVLPTAADNRRFSVLYKGDRIGAHTVSYSSVTGETRVHSEIDLLVKIAFFSVFVFSHRSEETWRAGRLMSLNSETVEHGETLHVEGAAMPRPVPPCLKYDTATRGERALR